MVFMPYQPITMYFGVVRFMVTKESYFKPKVSYKERYHQESLLKNFKEHEVLRELLDSSLISATNKKFVNMKIIDCRDYKHVYEYKNLRLIKEKDKVKFKDNKVMLLPKLNRSYKNTSELKEIDIKNINRTKIQFQRLIQCNMNQFKSFVTLTFKDNIINVDEANKKFANWRTRVKKVYKEFAYICVPEFQKRGAVHYHLLTNINYNDFNLLSNEERRIYNKNSGWQVGRDVKYWIYGYNMAKDIKDINVIGYMTKYMTKDIDNRLFSKRRYFYSSNLIKPIEYNLDLSKIEDFQTLLKLFDKDYILNYSRDYEDFYCEPVKYKEFVLNSD